MWGPWPSLPHWATVSLWPCRNRTPKLESLTSQLFRQHWLMNISWETGGGLVLHWTCGTLWYAVWEPSLCPREMALGGEKGTGLRNGGLFEKQRWRPAAWRGRQLTPPTLLFIVPFLNVTDSLLITRPSRVKGFSISFPWRFIILKPSSSQSEVIC